MKSLEWTIRDVGVGLNEGKEGTVRVGEVLLEYKTRLPTSEVKIVLTANAGDDF